MRDKQRHGAESIQSTGNVPSQSAPWIVFLLASLLPHWTKRPTDAWKILESACMHSWSPRAQRVNFALFGAHSREGIVIRKYRHLSGKNKISKFQQVGKISTDSNIFSYVCKRVAYVTANYSALSSNWLGASHWTSSGLTHPSVADGILQPWCTAWTGNGRTLFTTICCKESNLKTNCAKPRSHHTN